MTAIRLSLLLPFTLAVCAGAGCGTQVDIASAARLEEVKTGWFDAGITEDGKNKLVPSISLRIRNAGQSAIGSTQLNLVFKRASETEEWTTSFVRGIGAGGLDPGAITPPIVVHAQQGYTGLQPRLQMLSNSQFVDARVEVFAKHGSATWAKLAEFPIERQLLTR
jgi:hypothetical protein